MTEQDRPAFAELLVAIGETYGEPVSDARMEIYFRALSDLELGAIRAAADSLIRSHKFFPRPAELREAIDGSLDDKAERAWMYVLDEMRRVGWIGKPTWPDIPTKRAALELYGGWQRLCENLPAYGPELTMRAKDFKTFYRAYATDETRKQIAAPITSRLLES